MSTTDDVLSNAEQYASSFDKGDLPMPPGRKLAVVACMDARLIPTKVLGLQEGDAHVIRNAGGVVTDDAIRSLAISQRLLGTEEIILIHHTDCGMLTFNDDDFKRVDPGRDRRQAVVGGRGVLGPRRGRPPVDRPHQGEPVHPAQERARLRLRGRDGQAARGRLTPRPHPHADGRCVSPRRAGRSPSASRRCCPASRSSRGTPGARRARARRRGRRRTRAASRRGRPRP